MLVMQHVTSLLVIHPPCTTAISCNCAALPPAEALVLAGLSEERLARLREIHLGHIEVATYER